MADRPLPIVAIGGDYDLGCVMLGMRLKASACVVRSALNGDVHAYCTRNCSQNHKIRIALGDAKCAVIDAATEEWKNGPVKPKIGDDKPKIGDDKPKIGSPVPPAVTLPVPVVTPKKERPACSKCGNPMKGPKAKPGGTCLACAGTYKLRVPECACGKQVRKNSPGAPTQCGTCFRNKFLAHALSERIVPESAPDVPSKADPVPLEPVSVPRTPDPIPEPTVIDGDDAPEVEPMTPETTIANPQRTGNPLPPPPPAAGQERHKWKLGESVWVDVVITGAMDDKALTKFKQYVELM